MLGPAFGLPSIDAQCIAAIALLQLRLPREWVIVPTHDQTRYLPYLLHGDECISGFRNITHYIDSNDAKRLDATQRADSTAISSFIASNAQILLDLSLYVSFENYSATRTAFTKILPWHANYIVPPKRREAARKRTDHLGISSIDVDDVHEDLSNKPPGFDVGREKTFEAETQKRASLLLPQKNTVRSLLQRPEHSAVFKLHALADNFFGPLQDMLGDESYFLGSTGPQEVDCLAYGYLSLMLYPHLPQDWLAKVLRKRYPRLARYTERMHEGLKMETNVDEVMGLAQCKNEKEVERLRRACGMVLPWAPPVPSGILDVTSTITGDLMSRIPLLRPSTQIILTSPYKQIPVQRYVPAILAATATTLGIFGYYAFATGLLTWPHGEEVHIFGRKRLADYGHLGAALAGVSLLGQQTTVPQNAAFHAPFENKPAGIEMEVEQDGVP